VYAQLIHPTAEKGYLLGNQRRPGEMEKTSWMGKGRGLRNSGALFLYTQLG
jgi:hypothetical protein